MALFIICTNHTYFAQNLSVTLSTMYSYGRATSFFVILLKNCLQRFKLPANVTVKQYGRQF